MESQPRDRVEKQPSPPRNQDIESFRKLIPASNPNALLAYYFGVFALIPCVGIPLALVAIVLGGIGLRVGIAHPEKRGRAHAVVGLVLGVLVLLISSICLLSLALPLLFQSR